MSKRYLFTCKYDSVESKPLEYVKAVEPELANENPAEKPPQSPDQGRHCKKSSDQQDKQPLDQIGQNTVWRSHKLSDSDKRRQKLEKSKEPHRLPHRGVPSKQSQHGASRIGLLDQSSEEQTATMLIFQQNGEERLITFTLPKESCTLQEVLEQVNVPFTEYTLIQCMQHPMSDIDYFVSVGFTKKLEDMVENHPLLLADISSRTSSPTVPLQPQSRNPSPENAPCPENFSDEESSGVQKKIKIEVTLEPSDELSGSGHYMKIEAFKDLINNVSEEQLEDCWQEVVEVINKYSN